MKPNTSHSIKPSYNATYIAGKTCLVTGATSGIGKVTATTLAALGAEVIVAGRDKQKAEDTVRQIRLDTGNESIQYLLADFSDIQQVRSLAKSFIAKYSKLDVLVNNAGAFYNKRIETHYDIEMTFLVNYLAPFLLTNLLLETIQGSTPARIVNVSSDAHKYDMMDFDNLGFKHGYSGMKAYARSKLANILFTYELARRLAGSGVTVNALHPGHVATDIWSTSFSFIGPVLKWAMGLFALSPEQGADNTLYLASSPDVEGMTGRYYVKREPVQSSAISRDVNIAQSLWEISERLTELAQ